MAAREIVAFVPRAGDRPPFLHLPPLPAGNQYRFHSVVKPVGAQCNLACTYCFYLHKKGLLAQPALPRMSLAVLEAHIRQYIEAQTGPEVVFTWQGGEPTLAGLDFFRRAVELQRRYAEPGQAIHNDLQTNGLLLDPAWVDFLRENDFLVGLSIDGPAPLHDLYRRREGGTPTHTGVMAAVERLRAAGVPFHALCVVHRDNARRPLDVYRFLRDEVSPRVIQFLPCVEPASFRERAPGNARALPDVAAAPTAWSVDPDDWGKFLCRVWDEWLRRDYGRVHVDQFENVIAQLLGYGAQSCVSNEFCGKALAIEHDGSVYSCDHFVYPEHRLGDILTTHEGDLAFSPAQRAFGFAKRGRLPEHCRACRHLPLCWGDCPRNRFMSTANGEAGLSYLCAGWKSFYARAAAAEGELRRRLRCPTVMA